MTSLIAREQSLFLRECSLNRAWITHELIETVYFFAVVERSHGCSSVEGSPVSDSSGRCSGASRVCVVSTAAAAAAPAARSRTADVERVASGVVSTGWLLRPAGENG